MSASAVMPTIYRQLLRLSKQLDASPLAKALLIAQPAQLFDRRSRAIIDLPSLSGWSQLLEDFNRGEFYKPASSATAAVRSARTSPPPGADPIDTGLAALRSLGLAVVGGEQLGAIGFDCGSPSAVERVTAMRATEDVKPGSLLLTHPVSCLKQPSLHHSVILIVAADDDSVTGVVINKPLEVNLGAAVVSSDVQEALGGALCAAPLYKGGDVAERQLLLLHDQPDVAESAQIAEGLYATSSFENVREALDAHANRAAESETMGRTPDAADAAAAPRIKCVAGYAGWARQQLRTELERNVWFLAEADDVAGLVMMAPEGGRDAADGAKWLRDAMWSGALAQLGGEHEALARFPGDPQIVMNAVETIWEEQSRLLHRRIDELDPPK